jgi:hypothetical protein
MAEMGHEDQFPPIRLSGPLSGQSGDFAGTRGKGETRQLQPFFVGRHHR